MQVNRSRETITIRDVAEAAGVSVSTVSRVLNNKDDVAPQTFANVRKVIEEMGFASSLAAKSMRSRRTNVVGLIVPDLSQPYSLLVTRGVSRTVTAAGYDLLVYASSSHNLNALVQWEQQHVALLNGSVTDGLIVATPHASTFRTAYPLVAIDPHSRAADFPSVLSTNFIGVSDAMDYLLGLGHRRIGYIGGRPDLQSAIRRREGYCASLERAGLPIAPELIEVGDYMRDRAYGATRHLLQIKPPPTAILAASDEMALGVYDAAREAGLCIPRDLSVIGFDNIPESLTVDPPLTTVDQAIDSMGVLAAEVVIKLILGDALDELVYKVPTRLVVRQSCRSVVSES